MKKLSVFAIFTLMLCAQATYAKGFPLQEKSGPADELDDDITVTASVPRTLNDDGGGVGVDIISVSPGLGLYLSSLPNPFRKAPSIDTNND